MVATNDNIMVVACDGLLCIEPVCSAATKRMLYGFGSLHSAPMTLDVMHREDLY